MKKLLIIVVVSFSAATFAHAQNNSLVNTNKLVSSLPAAKFENVHSAIFSKPIEVSDHIIKKFNKQFSGAADAAWTKTSNGFVVRFTFNDIENMVFLTKRGDCEGYIRYYHEKELPSNVRNQVKSVFYDFSITFVKEITYEHLTAYLIFIEDKTTWKIIHVVDGEMNVLEDHVKG